MEAYIMKLLVGANITSVHFTQGINGDELKLDILNENVTSSLIIAPGLQGKLEISMPEINFG